MRPTATSELKLDGSIVTNADRAAERYLRDVFKARTPEASVWGEEFGRDDARSALEWVVDPIDGTPWYALGSPLFSTLIALTVEGRPVVGVISMPASLEVVYAAEAFGCHYVSRRARSPVRCTVSSAISTLAEATISASGIHLTDLSRAASPPRYLLSSLTANAKRFVFAGDALQHALVARGRLDGAVDVTMCPWDNAALIPCILEAGGVAASISGQQSDLLTCGSLVTASNRQLLDQIVATLKHG